MSEDKTTPDFSGVRCRTCRSIKEDKDLMKTPLDDVRLSVFCGICQAFLFIYDPAAQEKLNDILNKKG